VISPTHRPLPDNTYITHKRQRLITLAEFEPTIPATLRPQTDTSDGAATGIGQPLITHIYTTTGLIIWLMSTAQHTGLPFCVKRQILFAFSYIRHKNIFKIKFVCHNFLQLQSSINSLYKWTFREQYRLIWIFCKTVVKNYRYFKELHYQGVWKNKSPTLCVLHFGKIWRKMSRFTFWLLYPPPYT